MKEDQSQKHIPEQQWLIDAEKNEFCLRSWGYFEVLKCGSNFKVKKLHLYPNSSISLQRHRFRAEHWVVTSGVAEVTCGAEKFRLPVNASTFIPVGMTHQLANPSATEPLEIIEVQTGSYIGEDDIERF